MCHYTFYCQVDFLLIHFLHLYILYCKNILFVYLNSISLRSVLVICFVQFFQTMNLFQHQQSHQSSWQPKMGMNTKINCVCEKLICTHRCGNEDLMINYFTFHFSSGRNNKCKQLFNIHALSKYRITSLTMTYVKIIERNLYVVKLYIFV